MTLNKIKKSLKLWLLKYRSVLIATTVALIYAKIDLAVSISAPNLSATSITCLSILFGFNMVVVTNYYSNSDFNEFLKKLDAFNIFKNKYKRIIKILILSLIAIYIIALFEKVEYCFFNVITLNQICNYIVILLSVLNLIKAYDCVVEFFNIYGSTYSNTLQKFNKK